MIGVILDFGVATLSLNREKAGAGRPLRRGRLLYGLIQRQATMLAFVDTFWLLGLTFLALIPLMFLMKKATPHKGPLATH
jgi:hypothetical protein